LPRLLLPGGRRRGRGRRAARLRRTGRQRGPRARRVGAAGDALGPARRGHAHARERAAARSLPGARARGARVKRLAVLVLATGVLTGCGSGSPDAESVVRAWSQALNQGDNNTAGKLFAHGARVIQGGSVLTLNTQQDAVAWNAALPCSGRILSIHSRGQTATATFLLGNRPH